MAYPTDVWAVLPVKETANAKQRLAGVLSAELRRRLALAMMEDVLAALAATPRLSGIAVVTIDPTVAAIAARYGARILPAGARDGHTGAVVAAARLLALEGRGAIVQVPGDIPLITAEEIGMVLAAHDRQDDFVIVPAHDLRGSNAVLCAPPERVPLRFGDDSFLPHLDAARRCGLEPKIVTAPGIALDIDQAEDLAAFMRIPSDTRTYALLQGTRLPAA